MEEEKRTRYLCKVCGEHKTSDATQVCAICRKKSIQKARERRKKAALRKLRTKQRQQANKNPE